MRFNGLRTLARVAAGHRQARRPRSATVLERIPQAARRDRHRHHRADGLIRPDGPGYPTSRWQDVFLGGRAGTLYSGTSEIQRTIVGERALGLPKEPRGT